MCPITYVLSSISLPNLSMIQASEALCQTSCTGTSVISTAFAICPTDLAVSFQWVLHACLAYLL